MDGSKKYKLFIFDFDGTLGDTSECVIASFQGALKGNELPVAAEEDIVHLMGISLPAVFRQLTGDALGDDMYDKLVHDYRELYRGNLTKKTRAFPGVNATLQHIKASDGLCSIATSKKTEFAKLSCDYLKIDPFIDLYIGDDKVTNKKPHPEMLEYTLRELGVHKDDAVMIGDATTDIEMGKAIGMDTIAVTWGAHSVDMLKSADPLHIIHSAEELKAFI